MTEESIGFLLLLFAVRRYSHIVVLPKFAIFDVPDVDSCPTTSRSRSKSHQGLRLLAPPPQEVTRSRLTG